MLRRILAFTTGALVLCSALPAHAIGQRIDVQIVDRATGETLTPYFHDGEWWVAGRPGSRYGVVLANRGGVRTLNVVSVDGVNVISGDTAAWDQTGYVMNPYDRTEIDGWRKSMNQVAAFEFATLGDSYAARTGRPANVGVIGVAVFDERRALARLNMDAARDSERRAAPAAPPAPAQSSVESSDKASAAPQPAANEAPTAKRDRLGTAHGQLEDSSIRYVAFQRAQSTPNEIITIHYDRMENLIAMGIVPAPYPPVAANPFPNSGRFVADPPPRR